MAFNVNTAHSERVRQNGFSWHDFFPAGSAAELGRYPASLAGESMKATRKAVLDRIKLLEQAIGRAREYLESGKHAHWTGFRPLFVRKLRDGKGLPPHRDWVKHVFLARMEKALSRAEKVLERLS
jgi:hypothetical protein